MPSTVHLASSVQETNRHQIGLIIDASQQNPHGQELIYYSSMFTADWEELNTRSSQQRSLKNNLQNRQRSKYGGTITKAIINPFQNQDRNDDPFQFSQKPIKPSSNIPAQDKQPEKGTRRKRREKTLPQLAPLKQTTSTIVYSNVNKQSPEKAPQVMINNLTVARGNSRLLFHEDSDEQPAPSKDTIVSAIKDNSDSLFFEIETESNYASTKPKQEQLSIPKEEEPTKPKGELCIELPQKRILTQFDFEESEEEKGNGELQQQKEEQRQQQPPDRVVITRGEQLDCNVNERRKRMGEPIPAYTTLEMLLHRDNGGFNSFWPQFQLKFAGEDATLLAAKRVSSKPVSTFVFSSNRNNYIQNSQYYLGKMKGSLFGEVLNLFGQGPNPSDAKSTNSMPREMLATIIFNKTPLYTPRQFQVYVRKPQYRYYLNFNQVVMYKDEIPLSDLYLCPENRSKIVKYRNRQPVYSQEKEMFVLDFRGKAFCKSIKNFILQTQTGEEVALFGKMDDSTFNLVMTHPLSPLIALAVALTTFDRNIFTE